MITPAWHVARKDSMARKLHILYKAYIRLFMNIWEYEWTNRWINSVFRDMLLEVMRPSLLDKKGVLVERPSIINLYPKNLSLGPNRNLGSTFFDHLLLSGMACIFENQLVRSGILLINMRLAYQSVIGKEIYIKRNSPRRRKIQG